MRLSLTFPFFHRSLSPQALRRKLQKRSFQIEVADWVETVLRPLEDQSRYLDLCRSDSHFTLDSQIINRLFHHLHRFVILGKPGHDTGHLFRDFLSGVVISGTDLYAARAYPNDSVAAFLGAAYHDLGNSVTFRFQDYLWECGHAEVGAWLFYHLAEDFLPEPIRRLTAYAIAAHTHLLKPVETKTGFTRLPWTGHLFETSDGHPVGVSLWITRFADRLDTNGPTLLCRHILASVEGSRQEGRNLSGADWYDISHSSLRLLLKPDTLLQGTSPSALKHVANFALSALEQTSYSLYDHRFPVMKELISYKVKQAQTLIGLVQNRTGQPDFPKFKRFVARLSLSPTVTSTLRDVEKLWHELTPVEQSHWGPAFTYIEDSYSAWLTLIQDKIESGHSPLILAAKPLSLKILRELS